MSPSSLANYQAVFTAAALPPSFPTEQPQPDLEQYGMEHTYLFPRLVRAEMLAATGYNPPEWNKEKQIKRWYDSRAAQLDPQGAYVYGAWVAGINAPEYRQFTMTNAEAAVPNLPGASVWPRYKPAPTSALLVGMNGSGASGVNPDLLMMEVDAALLANQVGGVLTESPGYWPWTYVWGNEQRRIWDITINGTVYSAHLLRNQMFANGVGAPGSWTIDSQRGPLWVSSIPYDNGVVDGRPEIPIPCRDRKPDELPTLAFGGIMTMKRISQEAPSSSIFPSIPPEAAAFWRGLLEKVVLSQAEYWLTRLLPKK